MSVTLNFDFRSPDPSALNPFIESFRRLGREVGINSTEFAQWESRVRSSIASGKTLVQAIDSVAASYKKNSGAIREYSEEVERSVNRIANAQRRAAFESGLPGAGGGGGGRFSVGLPGMPGRGGGALGAGERAFGQFGGRLLGIEALGALGIPGGGFAASQLFRGLNLSPGVAGLVGVGAVGALGAFEFAKHAEETMKYAQAQSVLAREVGITASQMDTLTRVAAITGTHLGNAAKEVSNLGEEFIKGGARAKEIEASLNRLGLDKSVIFENNAKAISDIARGLANIADPAQRAGVAVELLKNSGRDLAAVANSMPDLADKFGISEGGLARLTRAQEAIESFKSSVGQNWAEFLGNLLQGRVSMTFPIAPDQGPSPTPIPGMSPQNIAGRADVMKSTARRFGTSGDIYSNTIQDIQRRQLELSETYKNQRITYPAGGGAGILPPRSPEEYAQRYSQLEGEKQTAENVRRLAQRRETQLFGLGELLAPRDTHELFGMLGNLPGQFRDITGTKQYQGVRNNLARQLLGTIQGGYISPSLVQEYRRIGDPTHFLDNLAHIRRGEDLTSGIIREDLRGGLEELSGQRTLGTAEVGYRSAILERGIMGGRRRLGIGGMAQAQLGISDRLLELSTGFKRGDLESQFNLYSDTANRLPVGTEKTQALENATRVAIQLAALETESRGRSISNLNSFNQALMDARQNIEDTFGRGFSSVITGAITGGGRGAAGAAKGFGLSLLSPVLSNLGGGIFNKLGLGGILSGIGKVLGPGLSNNTVFENLGIVPGATGSASSSISSTMDYGSGVGGFSMPPNFPGVFGAGGMMTGFAPMMSIAGDLAGGGGGAIGSAVGGLKGLLRSIKSGGAGAGAAMSGAEALAGLVGILSGMGTKGARGGLLTAGGGLGVLGGGLNIARQFTGFLGGELGSTLSSVLPGAGLALGLISSFLPDPRVTRGNQISKQIFESQYLQNPSLNVSMGANGMYADIGASGDVRSSNYSPWPGATMGFLDVPRRTSISGRTISQFGGGGVGPPTNMNPNPAPVIIVNTMDSASFAQNADKVADALHIAINRNYHPVIGALKSQLGVSS